MKLPLSRIAELIQATGEYDANAVAAGYSIDSRSIQPGEVFFAVKGERLDGHDYVNDALQKGAAAAVVEAGQVHRWCARTNLLIAGDSLRALQDLGAGVRRIWGKKIVAITGSAGKTTTKEVIAHVLSARWRALKSHGNFNNHFGLPLNLLKLEPEHDIAVLEMGMSHAGEIAALTKIAHPEIGVVTNVGPAHLENFDSVGGIARAKYELIAALPPGGVAVLNADDAYVSQFGRDFHGKVVTYGIEHPADVRAENIVSRGGAGSEFDVVTDGFGGRAAMPLVGRHNVLNALAAVAVATDRGMAPGEAIAALGVMEAIDKRGQVLKINGATIINDCYNSNPKALEAMVDSLAEMQGERKIVIAGEMLELGPTAADLHGAAGRHMGKRGVDVVAGVRGNARHIVTGAQQAGVAAHFAETPEEAGAWLATELKPGDVVLLKASRGVRLEKALEVLQNQLTVKSR